MALATEETTYEEFKATWLEDIENQQSTTAKGRVFARKLAEQWLEVEADEFHYIDGAGDLGIDVAYLHQGKNETDDEAEEQQMGDTWYLFQCKYGTSGIRTETVRTELRKMFSAITGDSPSSITAETTLAKIRNFMRDRGGPDDKVVLTIGTVDSLTDQQLKVLDEYRSEFAGQLRDDGPTLDVVSATVQSVHQSEKSIHVDLAGKFWAMDETGGGDDAWIGSVSIRAMYEMLLEYRELNGGDLDHIYDKNVRRWLGMTKQKRVNSGIKDTIENAPNNLGIFNNGVTLVCSEFMKRRRRGSRRGTTWSLVNPYVVNGCQTTRTLFEVVDRVLGAGGGSHREPPYGSCYFVVKVVKTDDPDRLADITMYTNAQNAVRASDLSATDDHYNDWKREMEERHGMYLEIQRGGWDSRKALEEKQQSRMPRLTEHEGAVPVKANDAIKVYGAGWLGKAGTAARRSTDFLPGPDPESGGSVFKVVCGLSAEGKFGADDLKAAHLVYWAGKDLGFAARPSKIQRAMTRYLFYYAFIELVRELGCEQGSRPSEVPPDEVTRWVLALAQNETHFDQVTKVAARAIDEYTTEKDSDAPYTQDKAYKDVHNWEGVVKSNRADAVNIPNEMSNFRECIRAAIGAMRFDIGQGSVFESYRRTIKGDA